MRKWLLQRRLSRISTRLKSLRSEVQIIDEQLISLADDADDASLRSLVSEASGVSSEARQANEHVESMTKHRAHVQREIADLDRRLDALLDRM